MRHALSSFTVMMLGLISAPSLGIRMSAETPTPSFYTYLLRLEHASADSHTCSLLKSTGDFHLEVEGGDQTRVFEGQLSPSQLLSLEKVLNDPMMQNLSQEQIEEPLMSEERDTFQIDIFRKDHWQNLFFRSNESQARFEHALAPLRRWLARVEKLPHRELSEDEGKNNCLPPKKLILKRRAPSLTESPHRPEAYSAAPILLPRATNGKSLSSSMLLGMLSFRVLGSGAQQSCALIANDGQYRFEHRVQASARKAVRTEVSAGRLNGEELGELRVILDAPGLAKIRHHEPPGGLVVRMMGEMLRFWIERPSGIQEIVLSSNQHQSGYFYRGDGDLAVADDLMKFLSLHVDNQKAETATSSRPANDCQGLP